MCAIEWVSRLLKVMPCTQRRKVIIWVIIVSKKICKIFEFYTIPNYQAQSKLDLAISSHTFKLQNFNKI